LWEYARMTGLQGMAVGVSGGKQRFCGVSWQQGWQMPQPRMCCRWCSGCW
jgi:hypothetical protein